jgi:hypothetical protein
VLISRRDKFDSRNCAFVLVKRIIDPDNEKELVKKLRLMPYDSYLCSFEKLKFLESKSRYEKIFGKQ